MNEAEDYIYEQRALMIKRKEKELKERENLRTDVRNRLLPRVKKLMSEYKEPTIKNRELYNEEQLNEMQQQTNQITNVSIPEIVVDVVGVRTQLCDENDMVEHIASRGIKFSDQDIVSLLTIMLDRNMSQGHATEVAIDILSPYIGQGRVKETHWRDYLINGKPKTILDNIAGRISRSFGVPHIPLSMTRIPDSSNPFPQCEADIVKLVEEIDNDEKRPVWG